MEHLRYLNFTVMFKFPTRMPEKPQTPRKGVFLMRHKDFVYEKVSLRHTAQCSAPSSGHRRKKQSGVPKMAMQLAISYISGD